jgi:hypothetical protein
MNGEQQVLRDALNGCVDDRGIGREPVADNLEGVSPSRLEQPDHELSRHPEKLDTTHSSLLSRDGLKPVTVFRLGPRQIIQPPLFNRRASSATVGGSCIFGIWKIIIHSP